MILAHEQVVAEISFSLKVQIVKAKIVLYLSLLIYSVTSTKI